MLVTIAASSGREEDNRMGTAETTFCDSKDSVELSAAPVRPAAINIKCPMSGPFLTT